jgi:hypothetical protein
MAKNCLEFDWNTCMALNILEKTWNFCVQKGVWTLFYKNVAKCLACDWPSFDEWHVIDPALMSDMWWTQLWWVTHETEEKIIYMQWELSRQQLSNLSLYYMYVHVLPLARLIHMTGGVNKIIIIIIIYKQTKRNWFTQYIEVSQSRLP